MNPDGLSRPSRGRDPQVGRLVRTCAGHPLGLGGTPSRPQPTPRMRASPIGSVGPLSRYPQTEGQYPSEEWMKPWSLPRPSHPLPASLLGQQRGLGKLGPFGSWPSYALLVWSRVTVSSWPLFALGEGRDWSRTPTAHPPNAPFTLLRGSPSIIRSWAGWIPCVGKFCFQRLF